MGTINSLLQAVSKLDLRAEVPKIIEEHDMWIENAIRDQLYDGLDSEGNDIRPSYLEDPFFKTPEQALKYSEWKDKITPNPRRKKHTPNLFINGYFYSGIRLLVKVDTLEYENNDFGRDIVMKYGDKLLGMAPETKARFVPSILLPKVKKYITDTTGLKFG